MDLAETVIDDCARRALCEDLGEAGDVTTRACVPAGRRCRATIRAKAGGTVAGVDLARAVFLAQDPGAVVEAGVADGDRVEPGTVLLAVDGDAAAVLAAERTALNFLQHLSGIATLARAYVDAVAGTGARILDTRKTLPGLRALERHAVRAGGGVNHRFGLFDQVLIKENHFAVSASSYEDTVRRAVAAGAPGPVIAEAGSRGDGLAAVRGGAGVVLLDNFEPGAELRATVEAIRELARELGRDVQIEVSGGVTLADVAEYAACGVDRISVGALTHSARALDCSLLLEVAP